MQQEELFIKFNYELKLGRDPMFLEIELYQVRKGVAGAKFRRTFLNRYKNEVSFGNYVEFKVKRKLKGPQLEYSNQP